MQHKNKIKNQNKMALREQQNKIYFDNLRKAGHTCISMGESYPTSYSWCKQEPCIDKIEINNQYFYLIVLIIFKK